MKEYFEKRPATSIAEASDAIEKITSIKRSPTQVREFLPRTGLRSLKVGYVPGKSVEREKIEEVEKYRE
ncbi:Mobile element protein [Richelia intracellularis]|nr:Mobile element protein [Richelia intracellularis]